MARKKNADVQTETPDPAKETSSPSGAPDAVSDNGATPAPAPEPPPSGNGQQGPLKLLTYQVGHDAVVQVAIWERTVQRKDGTSFRTYEVSLWKRCRDPQSGEWKTTDHFHATELFAAVHALQAAAYSICELRLVDCPF